MNRDRLEVHCGKQILVLADSSHAPAVGEVISIMAKSYIVTTRSYAVDYADESQLRSVCCCVFVKEKPLTKRKKP